MDPYALLVPWLQMSAIPVVDVFAGPGGLNEGFAACNDGKSFSIAASFEMEANAVETLRLRSVARELNRDGLHPDYEALLAGALTIDEFRARKDPAALFEKASTHAHQIELGETKRDEVANLITSAVGKSDRWALIGGPPCQAYSLVGRARRTNDLTFQDDHKHFLYREYLDILQRFKPSVFVMENVKGLLSAGHRGQRMFDLIMGDLGMDGEYEIKSLVVDKDPLLPSDYVIRSEHYGIPQRRHRVILLGLRKDVVSSRFTPLEVLEQPATVRQAIGDLPKVHSKASRSSNPEEDWRKAQELALTLAQEALNQAPLTRNFTNTDGNRSAELEAWLRHNDPPVSQHGEPRSHMKLDLARYAYLASMAEHGIFPRVTELPSSLLPEHRNIHQKNVPFADRFKVQHWDAPSSTVTSHIAKDGHYYIHPDAKQMRSLTVREAARLQTFPDDYYFCGNRTSQYHQVGNAVPPLLARKIAEKVAQILE